uniref:Uncharacterized protein n=1 Tax=Plectus sambesii TaxID=2011161 RepID=A0A914VVI3_9BILA
MTGKRRSSSCNSKTTKKRNKPQQTKSAEKSATNEEKVQLDYLIVEKIASLTELKFAPDLFQELVSSTFAKALRSFYAEKKLTVSIDISYSEDANLDSEWPHITVLSVSGLSRQSKEEIKMDDDNNLNKAIENIFARFPQIHLKIEGMDVVDSEEVACIISDALNITRNVTIKTLEITSFYSVIIDCQRLIKKLARNLQVLNLHIYDPVDQGQSSKRFWQTVNSCSKLAKLSVVTDYTLMMEETEDAFEAENLLVVHITDCLKQLKIKHFRTNLQNGEEEEERTMEWLISAFAENENLRELDVDTYFESGCYLGDLMNVEDGPLVLSRLESLKIRSSDFDKHRTDWIPIVEKILTALSDRAILKISVSYCKKDVGDILQMYLKISHRTARTIKLRLLFWKKDAGAIATFETALHQLSSVKEFRGLKTISYGKWTKLFYGNANLMVKAHHGSV